MSYVNNPYHHADAVRRNGILGQTQKCLDTLGSWRTYRDLARFEDVPTRIAQVTAAYLGLAGLLDGRPRPAGLLGVIVLVHALEQVTAGLATATMRLYGRGRPVAGYRGVMVRPSPFTPAIAALLSRVSRGRLWEATGYYFFTAGQTWHCQSLTLQVGAEPRPLTLVQSFSLPQRELFFDRRLYVPGQREPAEGERVIPIQRLIDVIKGNETPEAVPGFIGSVNELESLTMLCSIKHLLFLLNWLLVDPAERDDPPKEVDYEVLVKATPPGSPGFYQATPPSGRPPGSSGWPSTSRPASRPVTPPPPPPPPPPPYEADLFGAGPAGGPSPVNGQSGPATPASRYKDRIRIDGRDYPLVVKRLVTSPINGGRRKVDAIYYDDRLQEWRDVVDEEVRIDLARAVEAGLVSVVDPTQWPAT